MDLFNEKIVKKDYDYVDVLVSLGAIVGSFVLIFIVLMANLTMLLPFLVIGVGYGMVRIISSRHIEFEYIVTNGDLDIDKISAKRTRTRVFSGEAKDFEIIAKVNSEHYGNEFMNIKNRIEAASNLKSDNVYFLVTVYKGNRTVIFFEPNERMLQAFRYKIPRKTFI